MAADKKVALITGAASGMGKALATDLVSKGWNVACVDINSEAGQAVAAALGNQAIFIKCRVDDYDEQAQAFTKTFEKWGRLDAACLNAGYVDRTSIFQLKAKTSDGVPPKPDLSCTDVCWKAVVYGTMLAVHFMRKNATPGGQIVATSSAWGHYGCPTAPEYSGAKAAVIEFCRAAAPVLKMRDNITINAVLPGLVRTGVTLPAMLDSYTPEYITPIENVVASYNRFLDDPELNGQFLYCAGPAPDDIQFVPRPSRPTGDQSWIMELVCEPLFERVHGERSGLPDAFSPEKPGLHVKAQAQQGQ
ncbi:Short-chain dehydrogenase/reductase prx6 [Exophiala dermatitidis]